MSKGRGIFRQPRQGNYREKESSASQKHSRHQESKVKRNDQEKSKLIKHFPRISSKESPSNIQLWLENKGVVEVGFNKKRIIVLKETSPKSNLADVVDIKLFEKVNVCRDKKNTKKPRKVLCRSRSFARYCKTSWVELERAIQKNSKTRFYEEVDKSSSFTESKILIDTILSKNKIEKVKNCNNANVTSKVSISAQASSEEKRKKPIFKNFENASSATLILKSNIEKLLSTTEILSPRANLTNDSFHSIYTQTSINQNQSKNILSPNNNPSACNLDINKQSKPKPKVILRIVTARFNNNDKEKKTRKNIHKTSINIESFPGIEILEKSTISSESLNTINGKNLKSDLSIKCKNSENIKKIVTVKNSAVNTDALQQNIKQYENKEIQAELIKLPLMVEDSRETKPAVDNIPIQNLLKQTINSKADIHFNPAQKLDFCEKSKDKEIQTEKCVERKVSIFEFKANSSAQKVRKHKKIKLDLAEFRKSISNKYQQWPKSESYVPIENDYCNNSSNKTWFTLAPNQNTISDHHDSKKIQEKNGGDYLKTLSNNWEHFFNKKFQIHFSETAFGKSLLGRETIDSETRTNLIYSNRTKTGDGPDRVATVKKRAPRKLEQIYNKPIFEEEGASRKGEKILRYIEEDELEDDDYYAVEKITQTPYFKDDKTLSKHFVKTIQIQSRKRTTELHKLDHKTTQIYEYFTVGQLYCRDWIRQNLFYVEYSNPFTTFLRPQIGSDSAIIKIDEYST